MVASSSAVSVSLTSAIFSSTGVWRHQRPLTGDYGGKPKRVAFMMTKSKGNTLAKWRNKRMLYSTSGQWIRDKRWFTDDDGDGIGSKNSVRVRVTISGKQ